MCEDERFRTNRARVANRASLIPVLQDIFQTQAANEWIELLLGIGVPAGPINDVAAALNDPQVRARGMVQTVDHPTAGRIDLLGPVAKFSRTPATVRLAPPPLGFDTAAILSELLGYSPEEIDRLQAAGVI